ncbi:MAG: ribbon-helix-helix protein, CopG family [Gammaproteobacteria bacterium]|nr:ribbon-helix-helix protein, CopG family [Gammaproteobacteria bacterium]
MQAHVHTKVLTAHVPTLLVEKVDQIASRLDRSRAWIIKQALTAWISQEEKRRQMTLEALSDVDKGHVVDNQVIQNWVDGLDKEE